ncbi:HNH endonuclease [Brucella oryzae]
MTQQRARELFDYEPGTGRLVWKHRPRAEFKNDCRFKHWNRTYPGVEAGCVCKRTGYRVISLCPTTYRSHRIVWSWVYGDISTTDQIDHINGVRDDNRLPNLRAVSFDENLRNTALRSTNKTGVHGLYYSVRQNRWTASISDKGKKTHLGTFRTFDEALAVRREFERRLGYHPNHGRIPTR